MRDTEMVFITAGMGGGTGTGAAPVIAEAAKSAGVLTVAVVTKPFRFEGLQRMKNAEEGIKALSQNVDALVTIPNDSLLKMADRKINLKDSFKMADEVLRQGVQGIIEVITQEGLINCDFADVQTIMKDSGVAHMGIGIGSGDNAAKDAVRAAIESPILETSIENAKNVLLNVTGGMDLSLVDVDEVSSVVGELVSNDAQIIMGTSVDENMKDQIKVTLIATGLDSFKKHDDGVQSIMDRVAPKFSEPQESVFTERRPHTTVFSTPTVPQEEDDKIFTRTVRPTAQDKTSDDVSVPTFKFFRKNS
jgi:cell division protein FtsZ